MITLITTMIACGGTRPCIAHTRLLPSGRAIQMCAQIAGDGAPLQEPPSTSNRDDGDGEGEGDKAATINQLVGMLAKLQQRKVPIDWNAVGIAVTVISSAAAIVVSNWKVIKDNGTVAACSSSQSRARTTCGRPFSPGRAS